MMHDDDDGALEGAEPVPAPGAAVELLERVTTAQKTAGQLAREHGEGPPPRWPEVGAVFPMVTPAGPQFYKVTAAGPLGVKLKLASPHELRMVLTAMEADAGRRFAERAAAGWARFAACVAVVAAYQVVTGAVSCRDRDAWGDAFALIDEHPLPAGLRPRPWKLLTNRLRRWALGPAGLVYRGGAW